MDKKKQRIVSISIVLLCLFLYGNTLKNDYSLDDEYVMVGNDLVQKGVKAIPKIFKSPYVDKAGLETHSYRPVTLTSFAIEYELFGESPKASHFINLLLYAITCLVLFKLLLRLFEGYHWSLALLTTLLFLILPVHSEVVNNVKSRDELLCFLFAILSLRQFVKFADTRKWLSLVFGILLILLSLMSKLSSLTFLAIIPLTLWFFTELKMKRLLLVFGALVVAFVLIRWGGGTVLDSGGELRDELYFENPLYVKNIGFFGRIPVALFTVGYYLKLLVAPVTLLCYYGYDQVPIAGWGNPFVWVSAVVIFSAGGYALYKIKSKAPWIYGILFFLIAISMFSNLLRPAVGIIAERFVYLPSLGFCIAVAFLLVKVFKVREEAGKLVMWKRPVFLGLLAVIVVASFGRVIARNKNWQDKMTLLEHDVQFASRSVKLNSMLANELFVKIVRERSPLYREQMTDRAIQYYQNALDVYPEYETAWNNMGTLYFNEKRNFSMAKECYEKALKIRPDYPTSLLSLAYCYELEKDFKTAEKLFKKVLELEPNNKRAKDHLKTVQDNMQ